MTPFFALFLTFFFLRSAESLGFGAAEAVDHEAWNRLQIWDELATP